VSLFHRHQWQEVARRFVPPIETPPTKAWGSEGLARLADFANGFTVVELRCSECGDVASRKLRGDAT
jgi:hypothetical protein